MGCSTSKIEASKKGLKEAKFQDMHSDSVIPESNNIDLKIDAAKKPVDEAFITRRSDIQPQNNVNNDNNNNDNRSIEWMQSYSREINSNNKYWKTQIKNPTN